METSSSQTNIHGNIMARSLIWKKKVHRLHVINFFSEALKTILNNEIFINKVPWNALFEISFASPLATRGASGRNGRSCCHVTKGDWNQSFCNVTHVTTHNVTTGHDTLALLSSPGTSRLIISPKLLTKEPADDQWTLLLTLQFPDDIQTSIQSEWESDLSRKPLSLHPHKREHTFMCSLLILSS